jgi:hypothetical protein
MLNDTAEQNAQVMHKSYIQIFVKVAERFVRAEAGFQTYTPISQRPSLCFLNDNIDLFL